MAEGAEGEEVPLDQLADGDDEIESCGPELVEGAVPDEELLFVVLSPDGDPARIEAYHQLAMGQGG